MPITMFKNRQQTLLTNEWIKQMWYIYIMEYYIVIKRNEIMPFAATWVDPEILILSRLSERER